MKAQKPAFLPVNSDIDVELERLAQEKGVSALVKPAPATRKDEKRPQTAAKSEPIILPGPPANGATPRSRMKTVNMELPDYVWTDLKIRAAHRQTSVRHVIMSALIKDGIVIADADIVEDGRRLRGSNRPDA